MYLTATIKHRQSSENRAKDTLSEFRSQVFKQRNAPPSGTMADAVNDA